MSNSKIDIVKQKVFQFVVIKHPTVAEAETGTGSEIIVQPTVCCANDEEGALLRANRAIPEEHMKDEARLEVVVLPF